MSCTSTEGSQPWVKQIDSDVNIGCISEIYEGLISIRMSSVKLKRFLYYKGLKVYKDSDRKKRENGTKKRMAKI